MLLKINRLQPIVNSPYLLSAYFEWQGRVNKKAKQAAHGLLEKAKKKVEEGDPDTEVSGSLFTKRDQLAKRVALLTEQLNASPSQVSANDLNDALQDSDEDAGPPLALLKDDPKTARLKDDLKQAEDELLAVDAEINKQVTDAEKKLKEECQRLETCKKGSLFLLSPRLKESSAPSAEEAQDRLIDEITVSKLYMEAHLEHRIRDLEQRLKENKESLLAERRAVLQTNEQVVQLTAKLRAENEAKLALTNEISTLSNAMEQLRAATGIEESHQIAQLKGQLSQKEIEMRELSAEYQANIINVKAELTSTLHSSARQKEDNERLLAEKERTIQELTAQVRAAAEQLEAEQVIKL